MMERKDLVRFMEGLSEWFVLKGFSMVVEKPVDVFERIEFCQTRPVQLSTGWRMVRNHTAVLTKDPMCLLSIPNNGTYRKWLDAVGTCGMLLASGTPVQQAMYTVFKKHGVPAGKMVAEIFRNSSMQERIQALRVGEITATARVSYYYAFGVLPDVQKEMERYYDRLQIGPLVEGEVERSDLRMEPGLIVN